MAAPRANLNFCCGVDPDGTLNGSWLTTLDRSIAPSGRPTRKSERTKCLMTFTTELSARGAGCWRTERTVRETACPITGRIIGFLVHVPGLLKGKIVSEGYQRLPKITGRGRRSIVSVQDRDSDETRRRTVFDLRFCDCDSKKAAQTRLVKPQSWLVPVYLCTACPDVEETSRIQPCFGRRFLALKEVESTLCPFVAIWVRQLPLPR